MSIELYRTILVLLSNQFTHGTPAINIYTGDIVIVKMIGERHNELQVFPIYGESTTTVEFDLSPQNFLTLPELSESNGKNKEVIGKLAVLYRKIIGDFSEQYQKFNGVFSETSQKVIGNAAAENQTDIGEVAVPYQRFVGKDVIDRNKVSHKYTGELKTVMHDIERVTDKIVKNTQKEETISKTAKRYDNACVIAEGNAKDKLAQLKKIRQALQHSSDKQDQRIKQNTTEAQGASVGFKFKKLLWAAAFFAVAAGAVWFTFFDELTSAKNEVTSVVHTVIPQTNTAIKETKKTDAAAKVWTDTELLRLIELYAVKDSKKIFDFGRNKLLSQMKGKKLTDYEVKMQIETYLKKIK